MTATKSKLRKSAYSTCNSLRDQLAASKELLTVKDRKLARNEETFHQLIDRVAHHLRTPMTAVKQFASLMRDGVGGPLTAKQEEFLDTVLLRNEDLALVLDDLLDVSRHEAGVLAVRRQRCHVEDLLKHAQVELSRRAQARNVALHVESANSLPAVYCDMEKAGRSIVNLALNAMSFAAAGRSVHVWARHAASGFNQASGTVAGTARRVLRTTEPDPSFIPQSIMVGITDNEPGIDQAELDLMLARLAQQPMSMKTIDDNSAMGLQVAMELIRANFGELQAESADGGTTFWFTLPVDDPRSVLANFLLRARDNDMHDSFTALSVEIDSQGRFNSAPVVDDFLQTSLPGHDLVYPTAPNRWAAITRCRAQDGDDLFKRLLSSWERRREVCPLNAGDEMGDPARSSSLPELKMHVLGTWRMQDERDELARVFLSECNWPGRIDLKTGPVRLVDEIVAKARHNQLGLEKIARAVNQRLSNS